MRKTLFSLSTIALFAGTIIMTQPTLFENNAIAQVQTLIEAASSGNLSAVNQAIKAGADLETRGKRGETALLAATHANHVDVARTLIEAGADVNSKDSINDSPYLYAGARGHLEILKLTLSHGADLKSTNRYGGTAIIPASERGHVETIRTLIEAGTDVDHVNNLGWTALLEAIILGDGGQRHIDMVLPSCLLLASEVSRSNEITKRFSAIEGVPFSA